jgi:hypothetical protein
MTAGYDAIVRALGLSDARQIVADAASAIDTDQFLSGSAEWGRAMEMRQLLNGVASRLTDEICKVLEVQV